MAVLCVCVREGWGEEGRQIRCGWATKQTKGQDQSKQGGKEGDIVIGVSDPAMEYL